MYKCMCNLPQVPDCPMNPPPGYPKPYSMIDITNNWNTDSTEIPAAHYDSLCHFDYKNSSQLLQAQRYRAAEVQMPSLVCSSR